MTTKTIRITTAILGFLQLLSALFFWFQFSLVEKYGNLITLYMLQDFSAILTLILSSLIIILQLIKSKKEKNQTEILD